MTVQEGPMEVKEYFCNGCKWLQEVTEPSLYIRGGTVTFLACTHPDIVDSPRYIPRWQGSYETPTNHCPYLKGK
jgi:hypothetical protein